jgi:hypothetical protein
MPTEPKGKRRPTAMSGNAIRVAQIATGEVVRRQAREERGRRRDGAPLARSFTTAPQRRRGPSVPSSQVWPGLLSRGRWTASALGTTWGATPKELNWHRAKRWRSKAVAATRAHRFLDRAALVRPLRRVPLPGPDPPPQRQA